MENESNGKEPVSSLPAEYQPESESKESTLQSFPVHYNRSLRASAMCLSSEDCFSRRITSLGVYYPKDRLKQERQFARVVLELLAKKVAEEKGGGDGNGRVGENGQGDGNGNHGEPTDNHSNNTNNHSDNTNDHSSNTNNHSDNTNNHSNNSPSNDSIKNHSDNTNNHSNNTNSHSNNSPPNDNTTHTDTQITTTTTNSLPDSHQPTDEGNSHAENQQDSTHEEEHHDNNTTQDNLPPHAILSPVPPVITSVLDSLSQSTIPHPKSERKVSIIDAIQPPPPNVRPSLRLTNPDRLILVQEDDRQNIHAPRTPANVRGKRSLLHKAVLTSEQATLDFINQQGGNKTAINYFVNQADPHGFTPLMTSVCLSDSVAAMNITKILVENVAIPFSSPP